MNDESVGIDLPERLTTSEFWDSCYEERVLTPFNDKDWRNFVPIQLASTLEALGLDGKKICEVGGGDAQLTAYFAKKYPKSKYSIVDFSSKGCKLAAQRSIKENVNISIYQEDVFFPTESISGVFDVVLSLGVVEHFIDLSSIMLAKKNLLKSDGKIFTLIPNFSSPIYVYLCKRWSKSVFEDHLPHSMESFLKGHEEAGLKVVSKGFLGSIEISMLSMAMHGPENKTGFDRWSYLWLTRFCKVIHFFEWKFTGFPTSKLFSPFMYIVSEKK